MTTLERQIQISFHKRADEKRFLNRLENPFVRNKEKKLMGKIVKVASKSCQNILEIGCGEGNNLSYLKTMFNSSNLTGLDFSLEKIEYLKRALPHVDAVCGDATNLPFINQAFDLILFRDLLHHVNAHRDITLREAMRVLKPKGIIIILESNGSTLLNRIFQKVYPVELGMKDSTPDKLANLAMQFGQSHIYFVEASFAIRAVAFFLVWPRSFLRILYYPFFSLIYLWEKIIELFVPKQNWTYMMITIQNRT